MIKEFDDLVCGPVVLPDGRSCGFVSELNVLQEDILEIMEMPLECFSYEYLFGTN